MSTDRARPYGNFLALIDAVEAVGRNILVSIDEIDTHRSLNRSRDEDSFETKAERAVFDRVLRHAHAAERLVELLNRPAELRPKWHELVSGRFLLNDGVGREGLGILVEWANQMVPAKPRSTGKWASASAPGSSSTADVDSPRGMSLGFDVDKFIRFLDSNAVPHTLGAPKDDDPIEPNPPKVPTVAHTASSTKSDAEAPSRRIDLSVLNFKTSIAEKLYVAIEKARDPFSHVSVFEKLLEFANEPDSPSKWPLIEVVDGEIKYWDGDKISIFNKKKTYDRMRRLRKATVAETAE